MTEQNYGRGIHYYDCPGHYPGSHNESFQADCATCEAIDNHAPCAMSHDIRVHDGASHEEESTLWCDSCDVTIFYLDSGIPA